MSEISAELFDAKEKFHALDWQVYERLVEVFGNANVADTGSDAYDWSLEVYMTEEVPADWVCTKEQRDAILGWGFMRFWINFPDGTEQYCAADHLGARKGKAAPLTGKRKKRAPPEGGAQEGGMVALAGALTKARIEVESDRQDAERYRWIRDKSAYTSFGGAFCDCENKVVKEGGLDEFVDTRLGMNCDPQRKP